MRSRINPALKTSAYPLFAIASLSIATFAGCFRDNDGPTRGADLHPSATISIQRTEDDLEYTIKLEQDWLSDRYGPTRLVCEGASLERLFVFIGEFTESEIANVRGAQLLPHGTYKMNFLQTWDDRKLILPDVLGAAEDAFGLHLELKKEAAGTALDVTRK